MAGEAEQSPVISRYHAEQALLALLEAVRRRTRAVRHGRDGGPLWAGAMDKDPQLAHVLTLCACRWSYSLRYEGLPVPGMPLPPAACRCPSRLPPPLPSSPQSMHRTWRRPPVLTSRRVPQRCACWSTQCPPQTGSATCPPRARTSAPTSATSCAAWVPGPASETRAPPIALLPSRAARA
jgi:hypothetical protein